MSDPKPDASPADAVLVAYIDGELPSADRIELEGRMSEDGALRDRLEQLRQGERPFRQAFDLLLTDAPVQNLEAMLAALPPAGARAGTSRRPGQPESSTKPGRWRLALAAAIVTAFCAGLASAELARFGVKPVPVAESSDSAHWREVVAEYQALYTPESIAGIPDDREARRKELDLVGSKLGLQLSPEAASLPDLKFKRAQLFRYDDEPLGELTYLDSAGRVVALCIIDNGQPAAPVQQESRGGMAVVHWSREGRAYMLIGPVPDSELQQLASNASTRL